MEVSKLSVERRRLFVLDSRLAYVLILKMEAKFFSRDVVHEIVVETNRYADNL
jgi:hypothetical protein